MRSVWMSEHELLAAVRAGDLDAYGELFRRNWDAALAVANGFEGCGASPDDLASAAFENVLSTLLRGSGPTDSFRAYLFTSIRRLGIAARIESARLASSEGLASIPAPPTFDPERRDSTRLLQRAFDQLPARWQGVLWMVEVQRKPHASVARIVGVSPNGVAALAMRARAGLRAAYLQQHVPAPAESACSIPNSFLGGFVLGTLPAGRRGRVAAHLLECADCRAIVAELRTVGVPPKEQ